mgnify:CR=1 FL=1
MVLKNFNVKITKKILPFKKTIKVDSDKSLSIRSVIIGSISQGVSLVRNILESDDVRDTISVCRKLGVKISKIKKGSYKIFGNGLGSYSIKKNAKLYFGNSGTASRLLLGVLSTNPNIEVNISGDKSLNKRSMKNLINILSNFGASFLPKKKINFPLKLVSSNMPVGINYNSGVSAQLKSSVIFAGLNSYGRTVINEDISSRDHTENLLIKNTQVIKIIKKKKKIITIIGKKFLRPLNIDVGGDPSSAAFFVALTLLNQNSYIKIQNVGLNPTRIGFYEILKKHNAKIKFINLKKENNEIRGDILAESSQLKSITTSSDQYSKTTDEFLILFVIAALTKGISTFNNISELQNKESSRAYEMKKILKQIGVKSKLTSNVMKIYGKGLIDAKDKKVLIPSLHDHRVAMCGVILAALTNANTTIKGFETVFSSFPSFLKLFKLLGGKYEIKK